MLEKLGEKWTSETKIWQDQVLDNYAIRLEHKLCWGQRIEEVATEELFNLFQLSNAQFSLDSIVFFHELKNTNSQISNLHNIHV